VSKAERFLLLRHILIDNPTANETLNPTITAARIIAHIGNWTILVPRSSRGGETVGLVELVMARSLQIEKYLEQQEEEERD